MKLKHVLLPGVLFLTSIGAVFAAPKPVSDDYISDEIRTKLAADQVVKGGAIEVIVKDGVVTLRGKVEEEKQKSKAEKIAKKTGGVKNVVDEIQIAKPGQ